MGKRRLARELTLQFLYQTDALNAFYSGNGLEDRLDIFWSVRNRTEEEDTRSFMEILSRGVVENIKGIDEIINRYSSHWRITRMPNIDRNILRMAIYEIAYLRNIPPAVTINEAVEIAKKYGSEESSGFINGILDRISNARENGEI